MNAIVKLAKTTKRARHSKRVVKMDIQTIFAQSELNFIFNFILPKTNCYYTKQVPK